MYGVGFARVIFQSFHDYTVVEVGAGVVEETLNDVDDVEVEVVVEVDVEDDPEVEVDVEVAVEVEVEFLAEAVVRVGENVGAKVGEKVAGAALLRRRRLRRTSASAP